MKNPAIGVCDWVSFTSRQNYGAFKRLADALMDLGLTHEDKEIWLSTHYSSEDHQ